MVTAMRGQLLLRGQGTPTKANVTTLRRAMRHGGRGRCVVYTAPEATIEPAGRRDPPAGSIVTASAFGPGEPARVKATWLGESPMTPIEIGAPLTKPQSW